LFIHSSLKTVCNFLGEENFSKIACMIFERRVTPLLHTVLPLVAATLR